MSGPHTPGVHIPAIVLAAHGDDESHRRSLAAGAVAFLGKPSTATR
jgi:CheY-like chemotaxis protein